METIITFFNTPIGNFALGYITSTIICGLRDYCKDKKIHAEMLALNEQD